MTEAHVGWCKGRPVELVERLRIGPRGVVRQTKRICLSTREEIKGKAPVGGKRSLVRGFSAGARRRMLIETAFLPSCGESCFITLTFGKLILSSVRVKNEFKKWREFFNRRFPWASALWRVEMQRRGQAHFHIIGYGLGLVHVQALRGYWLKLGNKRDFDGSFEGAFRARSFECEWMQTQNGVVAYISKYVAKKCHESSTDFDGRAWGWIGKKVRPTQIRYETVRSGALFDACDEFLPKNDLAIDALPVFFGDPTKILIKVEGIKNAIRRVGRRSFISEQGRQGVLFDRFPWGTYRFVCSGASRSRRDRGQAGRGPGNRWLGKERALLSGRVVP